MRNYTGLAVWGCLFAFLALEFIDFDGGKAEEAEIGATGKEASENVRATVSNTLEKDDGSPGYRLTGIKKMN